MSTSLNLDEYLALIASAAERLATDAGAAGQDAPVPTCPEWTVADLLAHQGTVHRWATAVVAGALARVELPKELDRSTKPPADRTTLPGWFAEGVEGLLSALQSAPDDLRAAVFLRAAPAPRRFWARRLAHETTIHCVDALAARLGRIPTAGEAGIDAATAVDGLDELLTGFITRRSSRLRSDVPVSVLIAPTDSAAAWTVTISTDPPVTAFGSDPGVEPESVLAGSATALYLGLWNRGDEIGETGTADVLGLWRDKVRVDRS